LLLRHRLSLGVLSGYSLFHFRLPGSRRLDRLPGADDDAEPGSQRDSPSASPAPKETGLLRGCIHGCVTGDLSFASASDN